MIDSASRSNSTVVTPGPISVSTADSTSATMRPLARMRSISAVLLRVTIPCIARSARCETLPFGIGRLELPANRLCHCVDGLIAVDRGHSDRGGVVLSHRSGLLCVHRQPPRDRLRRIVRPLDEIAPAGVADTPLPGRAKTYIIQLSALFANSASRQTAHDLALRDLDDQHLLERLAALGQESL